jgi:hypothetical protein
VHRHCVVRARRSAPHRHTSPLFSLLHTPTAATGPQCHRALHVSHAAPHRSLLFAQQHCRPRPMVRGRCQPHPSPYAIDCHAQGPLSLSFPLFHAAPSRPPPPFPSLILPHAPTDLKKPPVPHSALFHIHARARSPLLSHLLCACLTGSHNWKHLLLSGSRPSTAAVRHHR